MSRIKNGHCFMGTRFLMKTIFGFEFGSHPLVIVTTDRRAIFLKAKTLKEGENMDNDHIDNIDKYVIKPTGDDEVIINNTVFDLTILFDIDIHMLESNLKDDRPPTIISDEDMKKIIKKLIKKLSTNPPTIIIATYRDKLDKNGKPYPPQISYARDFLLEMYFETNTDENMSEATKMRCERIIESLRSKVVDGAYYRSKDKLPKFIPEVVHLIKLIKEQYTY